MKTPLSYYGGKQQLAGVILELIPPHRVYCEPFSGGAAVFFAKAPSELEIINDTNGEIVNFYETMQKDFSALEKEVQASLHSRKLHRHAEVVYDNPDMFDQVKRAWAVWILANTSFGHQLDSVFDGGCGRSLDAKRTRFAACRDRLKKAVIECRDALVIIENWDAEDAFFYLDPPYVGSDQGHYDGYSQEDFDALLALLEKIKGKFLLSSFRNKSLEAYREKNGWRTKEMKMQCAMNKREKIEVLTANYESGKNKQSDLF
jgi:DNA adenine methylase